MKVCTFPKNFKLAHGLVTMTYYAKSLVVFETTMILVGILTK